MQKQRHTDIVFTALHSSLSNSNGPGETVQSSERENKRESERDTERKITRQQGQQ